MNTEEKSISVSIIGTGYVGLVTGATFAEKGFRTVCIDVIPEKVEAIQKKKAPFFEKGLDELIERNVEAGMLSATTDFRAVLKTEITFICVGTPSREDGSIDLRYIREAAGEIGRLLREKKGYHVVVTKSTVVPTTTENVIIPVLERESKKKAGKDFGVGMNPEFLKEGSAVEDSFHPDRIVIGGLDERTIATIERLYRDFDAPILRTNLRTAEMIKYTANAFLAMKISFANEIARLCERAGMDVNEVMKGIGLDRRISPLFLQAGAGFGGSCFPKDVKALRAFFEENGLEAELLNATLRVNEAQPLHVVEMLKEEIGTLKGKRIGVLGLAFKPDTDDVRETRALPIILSLLDEGAEVTAYDPLAMDNFKRLLGEKGQGVRYTRNIEDAVRGMDGVVVHTLWDEVTGLKPEDFVRLMRTPVVVDGRRGLSPETMKKAGVRYRAVGLGVYGRQSSDEQ